MSRSQSEGSTSRSSWNRYTMFYLPSAMKNKRQSRIVQAGNGFTKVCLMDRRYTPLDKKRDGNDGPGPHAPPRPGMAVGIFTSRPENPLDTKTSSPLQSRVHVLLPGFTDRTVQTVTDSRSTQIAVPPRSFMRALSARRGVGGMYFSDIRTAQLGELDLAIGVGDINLGEVRAEVIKAKTIGTVRGSAEVSDVLDVETPVYVLHDLHSTSLTRERRGGQPITLASISPPNHLLSPSPPPSMWTPRGWLTVLRSFKDLSQVHHVSVDIKLGNGDAKLRYVNWEDPSRLLSQDFNVATGSAQGPSSLPPFLPFS